MPGSNFSFEAEVESALQNFVEAEHVANMLMPSINSQMPQITEGKFKEYVQSDKLFKQLYELVGSGNNLRQSTEDATLS